MTNLLIGIAWGILAHQTERITRRMPEGWQQMTNYGIGWLAVFPFFDFLYRRSEITPEREKARVCYLLAGVFFGVGVGIGRVIDALREK